MAFLTKESLKKKPAVGICVWNHGGRKLRSGKYSECIRVYDTDADEVLEVIKKALTED